MARQSTAGDIHAALKHLKDKSNAKEIELIDTVASIYEAIKDGTDNAINKAKDTAGVVNTSVHMHPWHYVGGTAICAFLVGFFLRR